MTTLLVCSGGGHLKQLWTLWPRFGIEDDVLWVTFDTGLSRSLLAGEDVVFATYAAPRDLPNIARNSALASRLLKSRGVDRCISTGASLAVSFFPWVRMRGGACHYVESAARAAGPSVTGRLVGAIPGVHRYVQYPTLASGGWRFAGSVFDGFEGLVGPETLEKPRRVVVTLGTTESYGFRRLVDRLAGLLPGDAEVLWQTGATDLSGSGVAGRETVPSDELVAAIEEADLVVSHAGTGAALTAFEWGKCPVLVPREHSYGEHVDDHQAQIAEELARRGLAVTRRVDDLDLGSLQEAMQRRVVSLADPPLFPLVGGAA